MTRLEAVKKLTRLFGKRAGYRVDPGAAMQDDRDQARERHQTIAIEWKAAGEAMEARRAAILAADQEFQNLKAIRQELYAQKSKLESVMGAYKFTAGHVSYGFFHVEATGDTWEQVFTKLSAKYPNGKAAIAARKDGTS